MAVTVHFKNGGHTTVGHAVVVEAEQVVHLLRRRGDDAD